MRIVKRIPVSKELRKRKLYSKSVRYGIADKSMARMYSDIESEIFLIERKLENLKYKVRYYSIWSKLTSFFDEIKQKIINIGKYLRDIYNRFLSIIKGIFKSNVKQKYTVEDFIDKDGQLNVDKYTAFINYMLTDTEDQKTYDSEVYETIQNLDEEIRSLPEKEKEEAINSISLAAKEAVENELGIKFENLKIVTPKNVVESKHESHFSERNYEIERKINKFIWLLQNTKVSLINKSHRNKLIYFIISLLVFVLSGAIFYYIMMTFTAFYFANKIYFVILWGLLAINFGYSFYAFAKSRQKRVDEIEKYKNEVQESVMTLSEKVDKLNDTNVQAVFSQKLDEAISGIKELSNAYKNSEYYGGVPQSELDRLYKNTFGKVEDLVISIEQAVSGADATSMGGKSRVRGSRLFSRDRRVIRRKLRYI